MKKVKTLKIISIVLFLALLSGCVVYNTAGHWEEAKLMYIKDTGVSHLPVIADLDVIQTKITGTASGPNDTIELLRVRAINNALERNNADVLLEPRFSFETTGMRTTVTVTGFPASYKNFRTITEQDSTLIKNASQILNATKHINP